MAHKFDGHFFIEKKYISCFIDLNRLHKKMNKLELHNLNYLQNIFIIGNKVKKYEIS
jgi:hypothetical protein